MEPQGPHSAWDMASGTKTSPGKEGYARVVKIKTAYGTYIRPFSGLARVLAVKPFFAHFLVGTEI